MFVKKCIYDLKTPKNFLKNSYLLYFQLHFQFYTITRTWNALKYAQKRPIGENGHDVHAHHWKNLTIMKHKDDRVSIIGHWLLLSCAMCDIKIKLWIVLFKNQNIVNIVCAWTTFVSYKASCQLSSIPEKKDAGLLKWKPYWLPNIIYYFYLLLWFGIILSW